VDGESPKRISMRLCQVAVSAFDKDCGMVWAGTATEFCDAENRLSIYTYI
jgi:hypothetical protein